MLWVDPYPGRLPRFSDLRQPGTGTTGEEAVAYPWLDVLSINAWPVEPLPFLNKVNQWRWRKVKSLMDRFLYEEENVLIGVGKPSRLVLSVLSEHPQLPVLYDVMDDFPKFYAGISRWSMATVERSLLRKAARVWCSSHGLKHRLSTLGINAELVPNALDPTILPDVGGAHAGKGNPQILGYVGTIGSWFDWSMVHSLAELFPDDVVRVIGPLHCPPVSALPDNIELLPACGQVAALAQMAEFDVGLIPFLCNSLTLSVDPIKYYEYRGLGLPVLSSAFGEMGRRVGLPGVFIMETYEDLASQAHRALSFTESVSSVQKFRDENSWARRFDEAWERHGIEGGRHK